MSSSSSKSRVDRVREYVERFVSEKFPSGIYYHNIEHTYDVVKGCRIIGEDCNVSKREMEMLEAAAWLHDIGYYAGFENHEAVGASLAQDFLLKNGWTQEEVEIINNCILSTKVPQKPKTLLEEIICDADLFHLATEKFFEKSDLLWQEFVLYDKNLTKEQWKINSRKFVESQKYFTAYGKKHLEPKLKQNIEKLTKGTF
ncbi:MAG: HD domain-containing protein [Cyclobacteriaceae bacterium]|nr:HD domain-containing protein [Cyclobacteriaceae bacterium]